MSNPEFEAWFATPAATLAGYENGWKGIAFAAWCASRDAMATSPVDMVLHCTACGLQHIDAPEPSEWAISPDGSPEDVGSWDNPPHRSHKCHGCGHIWRPADVPTNGVAAVKTKGKADSPIAARAPTAAQPTSDVVPFVKAPHPEMQDALFCYATGDDGASAELIRGWSVLVARVVSEVAGDGWEEALADLDDWSDDGWGVPHRYSVNFEDGYMAIYRISEGSAHG